MRQLKYDTLIKDIKNLRQMNMRQLTYIFNINYETIEIWYFDKRYKKLETNELETNKLEKNSDRHLKYKILKVKHLIYRLWVKPISNKYWDRNIYKYYESNKLRYQKIAKPNIDSWGKWNISARSNWLKYISIISRNCLKPSQTVSFWCWYISNGTYWLKWLSQTDSK